MVLIEQIKFQKALKYWLKFLSTFFVVCYIIPKKKDKNGKVIKTKETADEKQVIFWNADYAKRAKMER